MHRLEVLSKHFERLKSTPNPAQYTEHAAVIIGGTVLDVQARPTGRADIAPGDSVPGKVRQTFGGVGRNIAHCLAILTKQTCHPLFISVVGADLAGQAFLSQWQGLGLGTAGIQQVQGAATPAVSAVFTLGGDVAAEVACVDALELHLQPATLTKHQHQIAGAHLLILDGNLHPNVLQAACKMVGNKSAQVWFEPVSASKAAGVKHIVLTLGPDGAVLCHMEGALMCLTHMPALPAAIANLSGAGDCLVAGAAMHLLQGGDACSALAHGMAVARAAVQSHDNGKKGVGYRLSKFDTLAPNFIASSGVRSLSYGADTDDNIASLQQLEAEMADNARPHDKAGIVSLIVRDSKPRQLKERLTAKNGKLQLAKLPAVRNQSKSAFFKAAKFVGDKRADVAEKAFGKPFAKVYISASGLQ
ncbi:hypothetical protein WJX73_003933 [Symbiochloris irregularis]|uniref:Carbohydrate kinase PfkB domain-containing protein n=1 Tax=Symbiochloris irregularis TaxID=706552 RepID=A0AAW1NF79_9CHLO